MRLDDAKNFHIHQGGEDDRAFTLDFSGVIDLANNLVCFVHAVDKRQTDMSGFHFKLGQYGVTKGFGGDAGAI